MSQDFVDEDYEFETVLTCQNDHSISGRIQDWNGYPCGEGVLVMAELLEENGGVSDQSLLISGDTITDEFGNFTVHFTLKESTDNLRIRIVPYSHIWTVQPAYTSIINTRGSQYK
jgi:hypothetical protein